MRCADVHVPMDKRRRLCRCGNQEDAIQTNNLHLLNGIVEASVGQGMHSFDQYIIELLSAGMITQDVARHYSINKHRLDMLLRGIVTNASILKPDQR